MHRRNYRHRPIAVVLAGGLSSRWWCWPPCRSQWPELGPDPTGMRRGRRPLYLGTADSAVVLRCAFHGSLTQQIPAGVGRHRPTEAHREQAPDALAETISLERRDGVLAAPRCLSLPGAVSRTRGVSAGTWPIPPPSRSAPDAAASRDPPAPHSPPAGSARTPPPRSSAPDRSRSRRAPWESRAA